MNKINWSVRFKNKTWLASLIALVITFVYQLLGMFDIIPAVTQDTVTQLVGIILTIFAGVGVIQDPTTKGISDSTQALGYTEPKDDTNVNNEEQGVG